MKRILLIEDERDIANLMRSILEGEGYNVCALYSANNYEDEVSQYAPNLVLLDLNIAGFDGTIICHYIKEHTDLKHIPVILISANRDIHEAKKSCGADDLIQKPFDLHTLIDTVHEYC